jgi:hypothetical protein
MMADAETILVRVLAATDAAWLPIRRPEWTHPGPAGVYTAQTSFRQCGGSIVPAPGTDATRKVAERAIDRLIDAGDLTVRRRKRGRFLRLTEDAEDRIRRACGLPGLWLCFETVRRHVRQQWTPETALNDGRGWGDGCSRELAFVELLLLPALARGIAVSASDVFGRVRYRRLANVPAWPTPEDEEPVRELAELYYAERTAERERILRSAPTGLEIGFLPLPAGRLD